MPQCSRQRLFVERGVFISLRLSLPHRQKMLPIILELFNTLVNIRQRFMFAVFLHPRHDLGLPAFGEFFERGNIEVAVVKVRLQLRHAARHEAAVLADRVAAHGRGAGGYVQFQEFDHLVFDFNVGED